MPNTQALANAIHEAYKADGGPVLIDVGSDHVTCVQGIISYFATVGGRYSHDEATGVTSMIYDQLEEPQIHD